MAIDKVSRAQQQECHGKVHYDGREGKKEVDSRVLPFFVAEPKQRISRFQQPEKSDAAGQDQRPVQRWNRRKIIDNTIHDNKLSTTKIPKFTVRAS